jgi:hypothetical protein
MIEREFPVAVGPRMADLFVTARDIYGGVPQVVIERPDVPVALIVASLDEARELIKALRLAVRELDVQDARRWPGGS